MMEFGPILRKMRKAAGMSQEDVGLELHMSISNVSRIETGIYEAKAIDVWRWANITGSQDVIAALALGVDVVVLQQALEVISTMTAGFVGGIL